VEEREGGEGRKDGKRKNRDNGIETYGKEKELEEKETYTYYKRRKT
jgi:hypothetical protein